MLPCFPWLVRGTENLFGADGERVAFADWNNGGEGQEGAVFTEGEFTPIAGGQLGGFGDSHALAGFGEIARVVDGEPCRLCERFAHLDIKRSELGGTRQAGKNDADAS